MDARNHGAAILLISKDLEELMSISDRLAVIYNGSIVGVIDEPRSTDAESLGLMMAGIKPEV